MYLLCQRSRKRRKLRKKPRLHLVLLQWWHHLQSTRPAQGNTVRLSSLFIINYYLIVRHDVWIQAVTFIIKGFVVHQPFLTKQQLFRCCTNVSQIFETLASVWEIEDKMSCCFFLCSCDHSGWSDTAGRPWRWGFARGSGSDSSQPRDTPAWGHYPAVRLPAWRPWPTATANRWTGACSG